MSENINDKLAGNPTTPEPEATPTAQPKDDATALLATLKELGVDNPEKLQGMATASQQAGKAWNEVGSLRKQLDETQALIKQMQTHKPEQPYDPYADNNSVDLKQLIKGTMRDEISSFWKEQNEIQSRARERYFQEMSEIKSNPRFQPVKDMWEAHINSPETQMRLSNGGTTLKDEFNNLLFTFQDKLLQRAYNAMSASTTKTAKPPHVESGETRSIPTQTMDDDKSEAIKKTVKSRQDGSVNSNDALQKIVDTFLPADDPIWRI